MTTTTSVTTPTTTSAAATTTSKASSTVATGQQSLNSSYSTFLQLLTTQLQNQDPTSPMDTNAFTQQLVQMNGVQQQLLTNQLLQTLVSNSSGGQGVTSSVGLIGKSVVANTANVTLNNGTANWQYTLGPGAVQGTATITNSANQTVWTGPLSQLSNGTNTFSWNGQDASGRQLPDGGTYTRIGLRRRHAAGGRCRHQHPAGLHRPDGRRHRQDHRPGHHHQLHHRFLTRKVPRLKNKDVHP